MDETMNIQTIPDIPENALANEPEYIIKKKFCFATIPGILLVCMFIFSLIAGIAALISNIAIGNRDIILNNISNLIYYGIQAVATIFMCVLMFAKVNKPLMSIPLFVAVFGENKK